MKTLRRIIIIALPFMLASCVSTESVIKEAGEYESRGMYDHAMWNVLTKLSDSPSPERNSTIIRIGEKLVEQYLSQARAAEASAGTTGQILRARDIGMQARGTVERVNHDFASVLLMWKPDQQVALDRINAKAADMLYDDGVALLNRGLYDDAVARFDECLAIVPLYKRNAAELRKQAYDKITDRYYGQALVAFSGHDFPQSTTLFSTVLERNPVYPNAGEYYSRSYDSVTLLLYKTALGDYRAERYRTAYNELRQLQERQRAFNILPNLEDMIRECADKSLVSVYFNGESALSNRVYAGVSSNLQNEGFIKMASRPSSASHIVVLSEECTEVQPCQDYTTHTAYLIEQWDAVVDGKTVVRYKAERPITYRIVNETRAMKCEIAYTIRGTWNARTFDYTAKDQKTYYECSVPVDQLSESYIPARPDPIRPSRKFTEQFRAKDRFRPKNELAAESRQCATNELVKALVNDLRSISLNMK